MKKNPSLLRRLGLALILAIGATLSSAKAQTIVFTEDWETDHSLDNTYVTNFTASGVHLADLYFDYSTVGIPPSPNSTGGTTRALKMAANLVAPAVGVTGLSVSPVGFGITENFEMRFDAWFNFNGPLPGGGNGSTQVGGAGYGTAGTAAQVAGVADSIFIGGTADGGSSADYRVYSPAHAISYQDGAYQIGSSGTDPTIKGDPNSGYVYAAENGSRNSSTTGYYGTNFPAQTAPLAQYNLFPQQTNSSGTPPSAPGAAFAGTLAFKWHDVSLKKVANTITYSINGVLIATVDVTDAGALGGANILFNHYDINATASSDPNRANLIFTLIDNVRITEYTNVVSVSATTPGASEAGAVPGVFTITRSAAGTPLTVNYKMSGIASNGVDYADALGGALSGSITFDAADFSTNITVVPIDDAIPELTETVTLSITPSVTYVGAGSAIVTIADNENPQLTITNVSTQMYERTNDYATFQITRLGDTNTALFNANLSFSGSATEGVDYYASVATLEPGVQTTNLNVYPIADSSYEGSEIVTVNIAAAGGGEYTIGSPSSASITLVDANLPAETVLFSDNFNADHSANWTQFFAANDGTPDSNVDFNFDYSSYGIPAAPHGGGNGLFLNVNKDGTGSAAALNLYPTGKSFSGNFALRFDMFLSVPLPSSVATEYALAGINHSGTKTNWWRSGGVPAGWTFDGVFSALETDNGATPNYASYGSPTPATNNPSLLASQTATALSAAFKSPPWGITGTPGNINNPSGVFGTPIWADVEISQSGNLITLTINNTKIYTYSNATAFASGNIMVGYEDAFDSISPGQSYVVLDNVRVVALTPPVITAQPVNSTNAVGTPATLTVTATSSTSVTNYQWFRNNIAIANATNASYAIASVAITNYGSYRVEVSDGSYTTVSSTVVLGSPGLQIVSEPTSVVIAVNTATNFSVGISGTSTGVTNYQWQRFSTNLTGTVTNPLNLTVRSTNYGPYRVIVSDGFLSVTSAVANLTPPVPLINIQPSSQAAVVGGSPKLSITATTFSGTTNYQWFYYGTNVSGAGITGATTRVLTLAGVQPVNFDGPYTVRVNDGTTSITSAPSATITVAVSPTVAAPVAVGANFAFTYPSELGPNYVVDFKSALTNVAWTPIKTNAGTGGTMSITNALSGDQGYFRIRLQ